MSFDGFVFPCERCGRKFYELTSKFEAEPPMKGHYVRLRKRYGPSGYNWHDFPKQEWVIGDNVACVGCGHPIKVQYILSCLKKKEPKKLSKEVDSRTFDLLNVADPVERGVLELTYQGKTQFEIAEMLGVTLYMVRKIQRGER